MVAWSAIERLRLGVSDDPSGLETRRSTPGTRSCRPQPTRQPTRLEAPCVRVQRLSLRTAKRRCALNEYERSLLLCCFSFAPGHVCVVLLGVDGAHQSRETASKSDPSSSAYKPVSRPFVGHCLWSQLVPNLDVGVREQRIPNRQPCTRQRLLKRPVLLALLLPRGAHARCQRRATLRPPRPRRHRRARAAATVRAGCVGPPASVLEQLLLVAPDADARRPELHRVVLALELVPDLRAERLFSPLRRHCSPQLRAALVHHLPRHRRA
eukprot:2492849-Rhodomonas_salina.2